MNKERYTELGYRGMIYKYILQETFTELYARVIDADDSTVSKILCESATSEFTDIMNLNSRTMRDIKTDIESNGIEFVKKMSILAEAVASQKAEDASKAGLTYLPDEIELTDIEKDVITTVFDTNLPEDVVGMVRTSVADALFKENEKSEEIRRASELIREEKPDENAMNESLNKLDISAPSSLMNAVMVSISNIIINENSDQIKRGKSIGDILSDKKDVIKDLSKGTFAIYETLNTFGYKQMTQKEVKDLSMEIYKA